MKATTAGKKKALFAAGSAAAFVPLAVLSMGTMGAAAVKHQQEQQGGTITIQSWVYTALSENSLSATAWQCSKISGVITDQSGGPTWQDTAEYTAPTELAGTAAITAANKECADKVPSGGVVLIPPPEPGQYALGDYTASPGATSSGPITGLSTFYSQQTIAGQKGTIFLTIASTYNITDGSIDVGGTEVPPGRTGPDATIVITGGTGAYAGLQGSGTWQGDAAMIPWCYRLATVKVWYLNQQGQGK
jgi:hypothetical protein